MELGEAALLMRTPNIAQHLLQGLTLSILKVGVIIVNKL